METEIRYSWIYNLILNKGNLDDKSLKNHKRLIKACKPFERLYKKHISRIISLIEKATKTKNWEYSFIPIYIIKMNLDSKNNIIKFGSKNIHWKAFGDPLTIIIREPEIMLYTLIHELVHLNLDMEKQIKMGQEKRERLVKNITDKVWVDLGFKDVKNYLIKKN